MVIKSHFFTYRTENVEIGRRYNIKCGAALITERFALTAAHCLKLQPEDYKLMVGNQFSVSVSGDNPQVLDVVEFYKHPGFVKKTLANDIAVVRVESEFGQGVLFSKLVLPICLPLMSLQSLYEEGQKGLVSGFGVLVEGGRAISKTLQMANLEIEKQEICTKAYSRVIGIRISVSTNT